MYLFIISNLKLNEPKKRGNEKNLLVINSVSEGVIDTVI